MKINGLFFEDLADEDCYMLQDISEKLILTRFPPNPLPQCIEMWAQENCLVGNNLSKMILDVFPAYALLSVVRALRQQQWQQPAPE